MYEDATARTWSITNKKKHINGPIYFIHVKFNETFLTLKNCFILQALNLNNNLVRTISLAKLINNLGFDLQSSIKNTIADHVQNQS